MSEPTITVSGATVILRPVVRGMNPEVKRLWLEALRSGEYTQTDGALAQQGLDEQGFGYCCLGVLCEVAIKNGVAVEKEVTPWSNGAQRQAYDGLLDIPPRSVLQWADLSSFDEPVAWPGDRDTTIGNTLIALNDADHNIYDPEVDGSRVKFGFKEIADIIEATY